MSISLKPLVNYLFGPGKGLVAADDKPDSTNKRLEEFNIPETLEKRTRYREIVVTTTNIEKYISGIIFHEETLSNTLSDGRLFHEVLRSRGIITGIKVDQGLTLLSRSSIEQKTNGLETLADRLLDYKKFGAQFCKWRSVFTIGKDMPTDECINENIKIFAKYTQIALQNNYLPILEPEVLTLGDHPIEVCKKTTQQILLSLFALLDKENVDMSQVILKTNMVLPGTDAKIKASPSEVAEKTIGCLTGSVPHNTGGIVFLSGGQSTLEANLHLNAICQVKSLPWPISFSFDRAFMYPVLKAWQGRKENIVRAQNELLEVTKDSSQALQGVFKP